MRLGVHLVRFDVPEGPAALRETLAGVGAAADAAGVDTLSLMDHWFQLDFLGGPRSPMLAGYTTLGFLAAHTERVELQLLMTGVTYRHPGLLAKVVATLDVLSGGRAALGIGAAWNEREHRGLGVPFPPVAQRFEMLEEALQVVRQMWSDDDGPYDGRHYALAETLCLPQPVHAVPVMVGGQGERKTLRLVARYADACNVFAGVGAGPDHVAHKLEVLRTWCEREGRPYDEVRRTVLWNQPVTRAGTREFLDQMRVLASRGVQEVHVMPRTDEEVRDLPGYVRRLGHEVVPALREL